MSIMSPRRILGLRVWPLLLMLSCQELNPEFCADHPDDAVCLAQGNGVNGGSDNGVDGGNSSIASCTSNAQCTSPTPICDTTRSMCVQCTADQASACGGTAPTCGSDDTCRGCAMDSECESLTCLPGGACEPAIRVLYAAAHGSAISNCAVTDMCTVRRALALIDGTKTTIRLDAGQYDLVDSLILTGTLRMVGRGAVFDASGVPLSSGLSGEAVSIGGRDAANIELDYVTVQHGNGAGILGNLSSMLTAREITVRNNDGDGIFCLACKMAITHSLIKGNGAIGIDVFGSDTTNTLPSKVALTRSVVAGNHEGGLQVEKTGFDVENNFIVQNGGPASLLGGVRLEASDAGDPTGRYVFAFNTVAFNLGLTSTLGQAAGVRCAYASPFPLVLTNNIVVDNSTFFPGPQFTGANCSMAYSDVFGVGTVPLPGTGNLLVDPQFVDVLHGDFHLQATSPVRNAADPAATLADDFDGDPRPQGVGREMGADEIQ